MTQARRVLAALRSRGTVGVTQVDFLLPDVVDGGRPITRVAARILELRENGHTITVEGERDSCSIYRLLRDTQDQPVRLPQPPAPDGQLFAPPVPNAVHGTEAA